MDSPGQSKISDLSSAKPKPHAKTEIKQRHAYARLLLVASSQKLAALHCKSILVTVIFVAIDGSVTATFDVFFLLQVGDELDCCSLRPVNLMTFLFIGENAKPLSRNRHLQQPLVCLAPKPACCRLPRHKPDTR